MNMCYPNPCYNEVCYKGTALYKLNCSVIKKARIYDIASLSLTGSAQARTNL